MRFRTRPLASLTAGAVVATALATGSTGCIVHGRARPLAYAGDATLIVAGGFLLHTPESLCSNPLSHCGLAPDYDTRTLDLIGGTLLAIGAVGLALQLSHDLQPEASPEPVEPPLPPPSDVDDVRVLTADAKQAAQAGACSDVRNLGHRVRDVDPIYFRRVFRVDVDIQTCLE